MSLYSRLTDPASFRLLRVSRDACGAIACELKTFVFGDRDTPSYLPVSCDSAQHSQPVTVSIDGHPKQIPRAALEVLDLVCDQPEFLHKPWLFLESICIDRDNPDERAEYVILKERIFGESSGALIWLGPGSHDSRTGMEMLRLAACPDRHDDPRLMDADCWKAYFGVVQRPWWRCINTIYEGIAPQVHREILYYCGTEHVTGREVIWAAADTPRLLGRMSLIPVESRDAWAPLLARRRIWQWYRGVEAGQRINLLSLLAHNAGSTAQDDRDRIYSIFSCVKQIDRHLVGVPRYNLTTVSVYTQFFRDWITTHQSLDIISFAPLFHDSQSKARGLPSWAPDWNATQEAHAIQRCRSPVPLMVSQSTKSHIGNLRPMDQLKVPLNAPTYAAAGSTTPQWDFSESGQVLRVQGLILDMIDGLTGMSGLKGSCMESLEAMIQPTSPFNCLADLESGVSSSRAIDKQYGGLDVVGEIMRDDVLMSLVAGRADDYLHYKADHRRLNAELRATLRSVEPSQDKHTDLQSGFLAWLQLNAGFKVCSRPLGALLSVDTIRKDHVRDVKQPPERPCQKEGTFLRRFHTATAPHAWNMRLVVTKQGYVGLAPRDARKGDLVCILSGYSVPAVLRRKEDGSFQFVGESYMQGFMEGQALEDDHDTEVFDIT